jgi:hypothetical protein
VANAVYLDRPAPSRGSMRRHRRCRTDRHDSTRSCPTLCRSKPCSSSRDRQSTSSSCRPSACGKQSPRSDAVKVLGRCGPEKKGAYLDLVSPSECLDLVSPSECLDLVSSEYLDLVSSECFDLLSLLKVDAPWLVDAALRILENCVAPLVVLCHRGNKNSAQSRPPAPHARMHTGAQRGSAARNVRSRSFQRAVRVYLALAAAAAR